MSNLLAMRAAGQSGATVNKAAIELLKGITDEATITALRYEYVVGYVMADDTSAETAIDYLPAQDAKPGTKGKWQPFPVNEPASFDAAAHRPLVIHNRYRAALTAWSQVRAAAGLASKVAPRAARVQTPNGKVTPTGLANLAIETGLDAAKIVEHVKGFDTWLGHTLKANAKALRGEVKSELTRTLAEVHKAVEALSKALEADAIGAPTPTRANVNEARMAETMETMRRELEALKAANTPVTAPADMAVDEAAQVGKRARKATKLAKAA